ncbi:peptidoglycan editing factor PgeF [Peptostreptococcus faecalis]|uniref:peptidoglycan editing factor PgeF n=1 Tax=Peptostreptococcus faecalis TaxID=2045015 RepID=UPI000C7A6F77|nr:peptidoglycan editing factor PgeF [Peptostreptococcus faecalis]
MKNSLNKSVNFDNAEIVEENDYFKIEKNNVSILFTHRSVDAKNNDDIEKICRRNDYKIENITFNKQIHSSKVRVINDISVGKIEDADALVTDLREVPLLAFTADCVPVVFFDNVKNIIGIAHAGWKGTYDNIVGETIRTMKKEYDVNPKDIEVYIGPSIGVCCYNVSEDLVLKFKNKMDDILGTNCDEEFFCKKSSDEYFLDLWKINELFLIKSGVENKNIKKLELCTSCNNDKFFSYRKDNKTEKRIGTIVQIF